MCALTDAEVGYKLLTVGGWDVEKTTLYDEEGVEGWCWTGPCGNEYNEVGGWDEQPPVPDALLQANSEGGGGC